MSKLEVEGLDSSGIIKKVAAAKGWVLDVDGCLVRTAAAGGAGGVPIQGAVELLRWLKDGGKKVIVCTNASQKTVAEYAAHLRAIGLDIADDEMMTAATAAAAHIANHHRGSRVLAIGDVGLKQALRAEGMELANGALDKVDVVVVGGADSYLTAEINAACLAVADKSAPFYVTVDVPWFHGGLKKAVSSSSAIAYAIAAVTGCCPEVCGKPSPAIAAVLTHLLGVNSGDVVVVGDMASIEIQMAHVMGGFGVLVMSGGTSAADLPELPLNHRPHVRVQDVGELVELLTQ